MTRMRQGGTCQLFEDENEKRREATLFSFFLVEISNDTIRYDAPAMDDDARYPAYQSPLFYSQNGRLVVILVPELRNLSLSDSGGVSVRAQPHTCGCHYPPPVISPTLVGHTFFAPLLYLNVPGRRRAGTNLLNSSSRPNFYFRITQGTGSLYRRPSSQYTPLHTCHHRGAPPTVCQLGLDLPPFLSP